jgi:hypothetical protein
MALSGVLSASRATQMHQELILSSGFSWAKILLDDMQVVALAPGWEEWLRQGMPIEYLPEQLRHHHHSLSS